jgi:hypothetical protein
LGQRWKRQSYRSLLHPYVITLTAPIQSLFVVANVQSMVVWNSLSAATAFESTITASDTELKAASPPQISRDSTLICVPTHSTLNWDEDGIVELLDFEFTGGIQGPEKQAFEMSLGTFIRYVEHHSPLNFTVFVSQAGGMLTDTWVTAVKCTPLSRTWTKNKSSLRKVRSSSHFNPTLPPPLAVDHLSEPSSSSTGCPRPTDVPGRRITSRTVTRGLDTSHMLSGSVVRMLKRACSEWRRGRWCGVGKWIQGVRIVMIVMIWDFDDSQMGVMDWRHLRRDERGASLHCTCHHDETLLKGLHYSEDITA